MSLMVLSIILLVSISGTVLGYANDTTNDTANNTINVTGAPNVTNTANVAVTETEVQGTVVSTTEDETPEVEATYSRETNVPEEPVQTPKSPGFGSAISIVVLLLAMYIGKRK